ncbi:hypothetical protein [Mycolicibacterium diernhoferi]|nr:hypothetical protein [Mycolicibacterium diernhoferi]
MDGTGNQAHIIEQAYVMGTAIVQIQPGDVAFWVRGATLTPVP